MDREAAPRVAKWQQANLKYCGRLVRPRRQKTMTGKTMNGVDVEALGQIISALQADPKAAGFQFRSSTAWQRGMVANSVFTGHKQNGVDVPRARPHELGGDAPVPLLGTGKHVGPAGHLLHSVSHCLAVTLAYHGAARGVQIDSLKIDAEGELDLQGMLALNDKVRPGYKHIHLGVHIDSPHTPEEVAELVRYAQGRSPMWATLSLPVKIAWEFDIQATEAGPDTVDTRNGVSSRDVIAAFQAIRENPVLAKCKFYTVAEWQGGARTRSTHPGFDQAAGSLLVQRRDKTPKSYIGDEPRQLLGADSGPGAAETMLHAMATCLAVTNSYHAAARGIPVDAFQVDFQGDIDLQGLMDLDDNVTPGFQTIRGKVHIKAGGDAKTLEDLLKLVIACSPMCDSVGRPVHLTSSLHHNGQQVARVATVRA
jgi:uncharacterized OsmC-like protein